MARRTYDKYRDNIRSGDLIFFRSRGWLGRVISAWSGSAYAHVGVAVWTCWPHGRWRLQIIESKEGRGVQWRALSTVGAFDLIRAGRWTADAEELCQRLSGVARYDWMGVAFRALGLRRRNSVYYCSEFAAALMDSCGHEINADAGVDPGALEAWAMREGFEHVAVW